MVELPGVENKIQQVNDSSIKPIAPNRAISSRDRIRAIQLPKACCTSQLLPANFQANSQQHRRQSYNRDAWKASYPIINQLPQVGDTAAA